MAFKAQAVNCAVLPEGLFETEVDWVIVFKHTLELLKDVIRRVRKLLVELGYLVAPSAPLPVLKGHELLMRPVQVVAKKTGFLIELILRIQGKLYFPKKSRGSSKVCSHFGHCTV
jgi:hypothetical protein